MERRRRQRRSPLLRQLERSLGLRLLVAFAAAIAAVAVVNRLDPCRDSSLARGCLRRDAGGVLSVSNLEALGIMTAGVLFILEGGQRHQRRNVEAMQLILDCQQAGVGSCHARNKALEQLCHDGVWMEGMKLDRLHLDELQVPGVRWRQADLSGSSLREADLRRADLREASLRNADCTGADLRGADLSGADLTGTILERARLDAPQPAPLDQR